MKKKRRRNRRKATDSTGKSIMKLRGRTKPPMVIKDKTKYSRKRKHKVDAD